MKKEYKKFNNSDYRGVRIFSKILNFFAHLSFSSLVILFFAMIIFAFVFIYALCEMIIVKDVTKELKSLYNQDFTIIENYGKTNAKEKGLYLVSPKYNLDIKFQVVNRAVSVSNNDYTDQRIKYYFESCTDKNLTDGINIEQLYSKVENFDGFLHYTLMLDINDYDDIEKKVTQAYNLSQYFMSKDDKMTGGIFLLNENIEQYLYCMLYNTQNTLEQEIDLVQYYYNLKVNNSVNNNIKPEYLQIYLNDNISIDAEKGKAEYNTIDDKYYIMNPVLLIKEIKGVEIGKISFLGNLKTIKYNDKKYKIKEELDEKRKKNTIYLNDNLEDFFKTFNAIIEYDFENERVNITIN